MSLRHGLTAPEENKLKTLIAQGISWDEIVARCAAADERGREQVPLFLDVNLTHVKKNIYDPLLKKHEDAKKAGFKDIHAMERAAAKKKADEAAAKKAKEE